jgi:hypothetical protein
MVLRPHYGARADSGRPAIARMQHAIETRFRWNIINGLQTHSLLAWSNGRSSGDFNQGLSLPARATPALPEAAPQPMALTFKPGLPRGNKMLVPVNNFHLFQNPRSPIVTA